MPFRTRLRRALGRSTSSSTTTTSDSSSSTPSVPGLDYRKDSSVYRPGEQMPRPKYRAPVEKKHKEMLESFDFINSWRNPLSRRGSRDWSLYSPGGSRIPSRAVSRDASRTNSFTGTGPRPKFGRGKSSVGGLVAEDAAEVENLANVGVSRGPSRRPSKELSRPTTGALTSDISKLHLSHNKHASGNALHHVGGLPNRSQALQQQHAAQASKVQHDMPFSQEDLEQALLRKVPTFAEEDEDRYVRAKPDTL